MAIGMNLEAPEIYQGVSEPFLIEEENPKKKPIVVVKPMEESVPKLPPEEPKEASNVVSAGSSAVPVEEPREVKEKKDVIEELKVEELRVPPLKSHHEEKEEKLHSVKKKKSKPLEVKPFEVSEPEKPIEKPIEVEKVQPVEQSTESAEEVNAPVQTKEPTFDETVQQLAVITGLGLLALLLMKKLRL